MSVTSHHKVLALDSRPEHSSLGKNVETALNYVLIKKSHRLIKLSVLLLITFVIS